MVAALQVLMLLLCVSSSVSQDLLTPTLNIAAELGKLKNMEEKIKNLEETLNKVLSQNEALKGLVQDSQNKLESFQKGKEVQKIAFSAGLLDGGYGHTGPVDCKKTLIYKKVLSNIGNAYDPNTGIFTAPVKGVYIFRFYAHSHGGKEMAVSLLKNGQIQGSVYSWNPSSNGNASNGAVLILESGDRVYTELWENTWVYDNERTYNSFNGFLLFPL